jgi:hypothetical protein
MTRLVWDKAGERFYENGVSRGVFYGTDSKGIPWNGLTSIEEINEDSVEPLYFDGFKYADLVTLGDFKGKLRAYTYPDIFALYEGMDVRQGGFFLANQPKTRFGLSYRTEINNDIETQTGYKIHLLYNLIAIPSDKVYKTLSLDASPSDFEWEISAIPEHVDKFRPTAHVVIDSRKIDPFLLTDIEDIIYGTEDDDPRLPDLNGLVSFIQKWGRLIITDNGDGTWTATSPLPDVITMLDSTTFQIVSDTAIFLDVDTYEISSSDANLEDIWPP